MNAPLSTAIKDQPIFHANFAQGRFVARHAHERWIKLVEESGHLLRRVALAIDADEYECNLIRLIAEYLLDALVIRESCRANVRAVGVAEEQQHGAPPEVAQLDWVAELACEGKILKWVRRVDDSDAVHLVVFGKGSGGRQQQPAYPVADDEQDNNYQCHNYQIQFKVLRRTGHSVQHANFSKILVAQEGVGRARDPPR